MKPHRMLLHWQQPLTQAAARDKGGGPSPSAAGGEHNLTPISQMLHQFGVGLCVAGSFWR